MSDTAVVTPPTPPQPEPESNPVRQLREALETRTRELQQEREAKAALESLVKEADRAKLDEVERLRLEKTELEPFREKAARYENVAKSLYEQELASVPEEYQARVETLSKVGEWDARIEAIRAAKGLLPIAPTPAGSVTAPAQRQNPAADTPRVDPKDPMGSYFSNFARPVNLQPTAADTAELQRNMAGSDLGGVTTWQPGQPIR